MKLLSLWGYRQARSLTQRSGHASTLCRRCGSYRIKRMANYSKRQTEPGQKSDILAHVYNEDRWTIIDLNDYEAVYKRIREYFEKCIEDDKFATVAGMANALNVSRQAIDQWIQGKVNKDPNVVQAVEWGKRVINAQNEESLMESRGNPVGNIFLTKNNFDGYTDTREIITRKETTSLTAEELLKIASKLPGFEDRYIE